MNLDKIGKFIILLRKEKKLTQAQLAEKLGVSDKTISKWERGVCLPDITSTDALINFFGISLMELYAGEKNDKLADKGINKTAKEAVEFIQKRETKKLKKVTIIALSVILLTILSASLLFTINTYNQYSAFNIKSDNDDYTGKGNIILTREKTITTLTNLIINNEEIANKEAISYEYSLSLDNTLILKEGDLYSEENVSDKPILLSDIVKEITVYVEQNITDNINKKEIINKHLILTIKYLDSEFNENEYTMKFDISKSFSNDRLVFNETEYIMDFDNMKAFLK